MTVTADRIPRHRRGLHPLQAFLLAGATPLFLGALLSDIAYASSYHIQWANFASWLIAGGLVLGAGALVWALVDLFRGDRRSGRPLIYAGLLLLTWILGFYDALVHARDAWAAMPTGLVLSALVTVLAAAATWLGFSRLRAGGAA
ncbi:hypothetical protein QFW77_11650 [Luteimonas sp. RD2P54]|uniref:DUF2231 domain-containing protein n=1 Tax=Luteimonas endophytica TaxID=3042023 RepID=A0ABT6JAM2_9GAMM|nr:DUF2231 domain-containing protein [Luteimonas endophytica]MDH5823642.1 hypothetical protein [Luteimonas endophytica]